MLLSKIAFVFAVLSLILTLLTWRQTEHLSITKVSENKEVISDIYEFQMPSDEDIISNGKYDEIFPKEALEGLLKSIKRPEGLVKAKLFYFDDYCLGEEAIVRMAKLGYHPANAWELLAFGAKYPYSQRDKSIVALGSLYQHQNYAPGYQSLSGDEKMRKVNLTDGFGPGTVWISTWFLGVE